MIDDRFLRCHPILHNSTRTMFGTKFSTKLTSIEPIYFNVLLSKYNLDSSQLNVWHNCRLPIDRIRLGYGLINRSGRNMHGTKVDSHFICWYRSDDH